MFDNEDLSTAVVADIRVINLLLTRSLAKVVAPSKATTAEKQQYCDAVEDIAKLIDKVILQPIFELHPDITTEMLTAKLYKEGSK